MTPTGHGDTAATVSVVIPSNRGGPYLAEAVASVKRQSVPVHEIILVDDGSPEPGLAQVARELGIDYVRQSASGVSAARNRGVARATGEWVALLDDDDVWYPEKIGEQLRALDESPASVACYSDLTVIDSLGDRVTTVQAPVGSSRHLIARGNGVPPLNTLLVLREAYITIGGCDTSLRYAEDVDLILRLLQIGEFAKAEHPLVGYRKYRGQATSDSLASQAAYLQVLRTLIQRARRSADSDMAIDLRQHLRRTLPNIADWGAGELLAAIRHARLRDAVTTARWGITHARTAFPAAILRTTIRRFRSSPR
jgi:glycosyltransferase involved in cell wall biosynthesis